MRRETPRSQLPIASIFSPFLSTGGLHKPYRSGMMCASYLSSSFSKRRSPSGTCMTFLLKQVLLLGAASHIRRSIYFKELNDQALRVARCQVVFDDCSHPNIVLLRVATSKTTIQGGRSEAIIIL